MTNTLTTPNGLTGTDPLPYGELRWNGSIWMRAHVDLYNRELARIAGRHAAGMSTEALVDGLYNLAYGFDHYAA